MACNKSVPFLCTFIPQFKWKGTPIKRVPKDDTFLPHLMYKLSAEFVNDAPILFTKT